MSDEALKQLKRAAFMSRLVSLAVCAGFLLGFGTILYISITIIQGDPPAEFIGYTAAAEDGPPTDSPTVKELSAKVSTPTPTVAPRPIFRLMLMWTWVKGLATVVLVLVPVPREDLHLKERSTT